MSDTTTPRDIMDADYLDVTHWYRQQKERLVRRKLRKLLEAS